MRNLIDSTYVTLDGVIQPLNWSAQYPSPASREERGKYARDLLFAEVWPTRTAADDGPGEEGVTDRINSLPKYVASTSLKEPLAWNSTLIKGDVAQEVARLKQQPGQTILIYGCGELARTLLEHDLIDEFRFWVYHVVCGTGTRLFGDGTRADLKLVETRAFAVLTCQPDRKA